MCPMLSRMKTNSSIGQSMVSFVDDMHVTSRDVSAIKQAKFHLRSTLIATVTSVSMLFILQLMNTLVVCTDQQNSK